jgi:hypothetical protein
LKIANVDLSAGVLTIEDGKFGDTGSLNGGAGYFCNAAYAC